MNEIKKAAIIFPGIGYHRDKPLLYYSAKLAIAKGYKVISIEYHDMPKKIRGNKEMMKKAAEIAFEQSEIRLSEAALPQYDRLLFIGKSIGTVAMADYVSKHGIDALQIWYTPVEATFSYDTKDVIAFIGDADPWSDVNRIKTMAGEKGIKLYSYPDCNHSLECESVEKNLEILRDVMDKTEKYMDEF
ncbi:MAG: alpha/beta hydrolase [Lachnospiraceae bacterium]|nr:alpha/beta hydrolase [Lachnospiraceae bacterium]